MTVIGRGELQATDSKEIGNLDLCFLTGLGLRGATMMLALEYGILAVRDMEW